MTKLLLFPVSLLSSLAIIIWVVYPTFKEAQRIKNVELPEVQKELEMELEISKNIVNLQQEYETNKDSLKMLEYALPVDNDLKSLLTQLETMVLESSLAYRDIGITDESLQKSSANQQFTASGVATQQNFLLPQPSAIGLNFNVGGSYEGIKEFIEKVENLDRLANITSLAITAETQKSGEETGGGTLLKAEISLEAYKQESIDSEDIKKAFNFRTSSNDQSGSASKNVEATKEEMQK